MAIKSVIGREMPIRTSGSVSRNTQSAHFDGVDDLITAAATAVGNLNTSFSVHLFVRLDTLGAGYQTFIQERKTDNTGPYPFYIAQRNTGNIETGTNSNTILTSNAPLAANTWYEVLIIRNGTADTLNLYVDRTLHTSIALTDGDDRATTPANLSMGANQASSNILDGLLKDAKIFNVALNATNIALLTVANIGKSPSEINGWDTANAADTNLLRLYNFEPPWSNATVNTASQVKDTGSAALHGTGANFAASASSGVDTVVPS